MLRLAEIPYLNCAPFYWNKDLKNGKVKWIAASPKKLGAMAKSGLIDAGPISLVDSFQLEAEYEPLGNFGIATDRSVKSVMLFSKKPIALLEGQTIGLTTESVTSIRLLQCLLKKRYHIQANYRIGFKNNDNAQLYIGDRALKKLKDHPKHLYKRFPFVTDLGEEWENWKKLPFVFARWIVRKDLPTSEKKILCEWLTKNIKTGPSKLNDAQKNYLSHFHYTLGPKELKAIQTFRQIISDRHQLI